MAKRVALRRRTPLRADPVKVREWRDRSRQEIPRTVRLAPVNRVRKARLAEHQYGPAGYGDWLRSLACVVPGCRDERIECAHVRSRGAGGTWEDQVPLCTVHHSEQHALGVRTFARRYGLDLADLAAAHALRWRSFAGGAGDAEALGSE